MDSAPQAPRIFALLVGINRYRAPFIPQLGGCVNDVEAMAELLTNRFAVPPAQITRLTDEAATRMGIIEQLRRALIEPIAAALAAHPDEPPPAALFYYSGHGSQARDTTGHEADGFDETIVPHDSRTAGVFDLRDWELGMRIAELGELTPNITVILDCCHSGGGTRTVAPSFAPLLAPKRIEADDRPPPPRPQEVRMNRALTLSGWSRGRLHVLLAACRSDQVAYELPLPGTPPRRHGALTTALLEVLAGDHGRRPLTWHALYALVSVKINLRLGCQSPVLEGNGARLLFDRPEPLPPPVWLLDNTLGEPAEENAGPLFPGDTAAEEDETTPPAFYRLNAGLAHGLRPGARVGVWPYTFDAHAPDAGELVAQLEVVDAGACTARCRVIAGPTQLALPLRAWLLARSPAARRLTAATAGDLTALQEALGSAGGENWVLLTEGPADLVLPPATAEGQPLLDGGGGQLLLLPTDATPAEMAGALIQIARYRAALAVANDQPTVPVAGTVAMQLWWHTGDAEEPLLPAAGDDGVVTVAEGDLVALEIGNDTSEALFVNIFNFGADWSITRLWPPPGIAAEPIPPGGHFWIGRDEYDDPIEAGMLPGVAAVRETLKLFATALPLETSTLEMAPWSPDEPVERALEAGLFATMLDRLEGAGGRNDEADGRIWLTAAVPVITVAAGEAPVPLRGGRLTRFERYGVEILPPPGFRGMAGLQPPGRRSPELAAAALPVPPALLDRVEPWPLYPTRSNTPGALWLSYDETAAATVTAATPLRVKVPLPEGETPHLLAVLDDGEFYYPVGLNRPEDAGILYIDWLPLPEPGAVPPGGAQGSPFAGQAGERNLTRTVQLYIYKLLHKLHPALGLHRVTPLLPGDPPLLAGEEERASNAGPLRYSPVAAESFAMGDRIAIVTHGFSADAIYQAVWALTDLRDRGVWYDHLLTFDYDSYSTGVRENGRLLADSLRAAGFAKDDGLHVDLIAHSMGGLVARCALEMWEADELIDRCALIGTPHLGTRVAHLKQLAPWLVSLAINQITNLPPAVIIGWLLDQISGDGEGPNDLLPGAGAQTDLNAATTPLGIPYLLMAGTNVRRPTGSRFDRLWQALHHTIDGELDRFFGDDHDLIVTVQSALGLRNGGYPVDMITTTIVAADHYSFFDRNDSCARLADWLAQEPAAEITEESGERARA